MDQDPHGLPAGDVVDRMQREWALLAVLRGEPLLDPYRADPRFHSLLHLMNLV